MGLGAWGLGLGSFGLLVDVPPVVLLLLRLEEVLGDVLRTSMATDQFSYCWLAGNEVIRALYVPFEGSYRVPHSPISY